MSETRRLKRKLERAWKKAATKNPVPITMGNLDMKKLEKIINDLTKEQHESKT